MGEGHAVSLSLLTFKAFSKIILTFLIIYCVNPYVLSLSSFLYKVKMRV